MARPTEIRFLSEDFRRLIIRGDEGDRIKEFRVFQILNGQHIIELLAFQCSGVECPFSPLAFWYLAMKQGASLVLLDLTFGPTSIFTGYHIKTLCALQNLGSLKLGGMRISSVDDEILKDCQMGNLHTLLLDSLQMTASELTSILGICPTLVNLQLGACVALDNPVITSNTMRTLYVKRLPEVDGGGGERDLRPHPPTMRELTVDASKLLYLVVDEARHVIVRNGAQSLELLKLGPQVEQLSSETEFTSLKILVVEGSIGNYMFYSLLLRSCMSLHKVVIGSETFSRLARDPAISNALEDLRERLVNVVVLAVTLGQDNYMAKLVLLEKLVGACPHLTELQLRSQNSDSVKWFKAGAEISRSRPLLSITCT